MDYRINNTALLDALALWNRFLRRKVHLIACGGTAMTLLGVKDSTKEVDFMVPVPAEHAYLIKQLSALGYIRETASGWKKEGEIIQYDLFCGNRIHTTELSHSPLEEGRHSLLKQFSRLYIGILNDYDLMASKLMRGTAVDFEDCTALFEAHRESLDISVLEARFDELVDYDTSELRIRPNIRVFKESLRKKGLYGN